MRLQIDSRYPIHMTVSAEDFGKHFAAMDSEEQVAVLRVMIEETHPLQWDHVAIELEEPENADVREKFARIARYVTEAQP